MLLKLLQLPQLKLRKKPKLLLLTGRRPRMEPQPKKASLLKKRIKNLHVRARSHPKKAKSKRSQTSSVSTIFQFQTEFPLSMVKQFHRCQHVDITTMQWLAKATRSTHGAWAKITCSELVMMRMNTSQS